jgi:hypothetical protein
VLVNIDWRIIFCSFYKADRVNISVRVKGIDKIPPNKIFEMEECLFLIETQVESELESD